MISKKTLRDEILNFNEKKYVFLIPLAIIGIIGLLIPIIPGLLILFLVFAIVAPDKANDTVRKVRDWIQTVIRKIIDR